MLSRANINTRLLYLIAAHAGWDKRGVVGKKLGIQKSRWTRILRHNEQLYDAEIVAIKKYFNSNYEWILEGQDKDEEEKDIRALFNFITKALKPKERLDLLDVIAEQEKY